MTVTISQVKGIVGGALLTVALFFSGFFVMFTSVPLFVVGATRGRGVLVGAAILAALVLAGVHRGSFPLFEAATFGFYVMVAFLLSEGLRRQWSITAMFGRALLGGLLVVLGSGIVIVMQGDFSLGEGLRSEVGTVVDEVMKLRGFTIDLDRNEIVAMATKIFPAVMVIFSIMSVALSGIVGFKFLRRHPSFHHSPRPASFRLPDAWVWFPIACGLLFFSNRYLVHSDRLAMVALNVVLISAVLAFLQGFAVVTFFVQRLRTRWFRALIYGMILFFFQTIGIVVAGVGLADVWMNFRQGGKPCT